MKQVMILVGLCFLVITPFLTGCGQTKIRVGSKIGQESLLLAQMIILILEENGYEVIDMTPTGSTEETWRALISKDIDICPEYTGNYERLVKKLGDENESQIVWLKPAPANNKWGIAITEELSRSCIENITTIKQFRDYITNNKTDYEIGEKKEVKLICSPEYITNPEALPKFESEYDFMFPRDSSHLKIFPSTNTAYLAEMAQKDNTINAFMVYTTDAHLGKYDLVLLEDDLPAQNDFHPAPIMRKEYYNELDKDKINRILTPLFTSLDDETLIKLNSKIGLSGTQAISEVARQYLIENGFFKYNEFEMVQNAVEELRISTDGNFRELSKDVTEDGISDMSVFPKNTNKLYIETNIALVDISDNTLASWSYITWKKTIGTYTCDSDGSVNQVETGW